MCSLKGVQSLQCILRLIKQTLVQRRQVKRAPLRRRAPQERADCRECLGVPTSPSQILDAAQLVGIEVKPRHGSFTVTSSVRNGPLLAMPRQPDFEKMPIGWPQ